MEPMYDVIIIGGGPAGYTAALYATRAGLKVLVLELMGPGGQMTLTDSIDNYPGYPEGIDGFTLGLNMQKGAERFGAKTEYARVIKIDTEAEGNTKVVVTTNGIHRSKAVIIATGAKERELGVPNEKGYIGKGLHYCAHCDGSFYKDKVVVVVGGGNTAVTDALYLSNIANKVMLIHRRDMLRADNVYVDALKKSNNIEVIWNSKVKELVTEEGKLIGIVVANVVTEKEEQVSCDGVFVSIGRIPITDFIEGIHKDTSGYIIADETTRTNIEGIFVAGDVRTKELRQIVTATADGAVAAHYAEIYISQKSF